MAPAPLARGAGLEEDWAKQNLSALVCPTGLGFWRAAVDAPCCLDPSAAAGAQAGCAVSAEWGRQCTLQTLAARLAHRLPELRTSAAGTLGRLARPGDGIAVEALSRTLADEAPEVRLAASQALGLLAERGDPAARDALAAARGAHGDPAVRGAAISELGRLCERGDADAVAGLSRCSADASPLVRERAARALPAAAEPGDAGAIAAAAALLGDPEAEVQRAAVDALVALAGERPQHAEAVILPAASAAEHGDALAREAALEVLTRVAPRNHGPAVGAALRCLEHREPRVRMAAVSCLGGLVQAGDLAASTALAEEAHGDDSPSIRLTALEVLLELAAEADVAALAAVVACREHHDHALRSAAVDNLGQVLDSILVIARAAPCTNASGAKASGLDFAEAALAQLRRCGHHSRSAAARLLGLVLPLRGEAVALRAAVTSLKDRGCDWRTRVTVEAAGKILISHLTSTSGKTAALPALVVLVGLLRDADARVRRSAASAMGVLAARARTSLGGTRPRAQGLGA